jgi:alpha-tubulin suppressor-like RCC1 family protein
MPPPVADAGIHPLGDPNALDAIVEVDLSTYFGCLRRNNGTVACWGQPYGSLTEIEGVDAVSLVVGGAYACSRSANDPIRCWSDASGTVELNGASDVIQLALGGAVCALDLNGQVWCWQDGVGSPPTKIANRADVVGIAAGDMHACAVTDSGVVACWGNNGQGQLGVPGRGGPTPKRVTGIPPIEDIDANGRQTCAMTKDGSAYCWGAPPTTPAVPTPYEVKGVPPVTGLAVGRRFICVLAGEGDVWCWGQNPDGVLGDGSRSAVDGPVQARIDNVDQLAAGEGSACAVRSGELYCWGDNDRGQLMRPAGSSTPVDVAGVADVAELVASSNTTCAVHADRTVSCWGRALAPDDLFLTPQKIPGLTDVESLHMSDIHACAIRAGGSVACFGYNGQGQLGDGTTDSATGAVAVSNLTVATQLAVGGDFTCAVGTGGKVQCWGAVHKGVLGVRGASRADDVATTPREVAGLTNVVDLVTGSHDLCAIVKGGDVACWGAHRDHGTKCKPGMGENLVCTDHPSAAPATVAGVSKIEHVVLIDSHRGRLYAADGKEYTLWLVPKGVPGSEFDMMGSSEYGEYEVGARAQLLRERHWHGYPTPEFCMVGDDATVTCASDNQHGEAGQGHFEAVHTPTAVPNLIDVKSVATGRRHACALLIGGTVKCWGNNAYGQLGPDEASNTGIPAPIPL